MSIHLAKEPENRLGSGAIQDLLLPESLADSLTDSANRAFALVVSRNATGRNTASILDSTGERWHSGLRESGCLPTRISARTSQKKLLRCVTSGAGRLPGNCGVEFATCRDGDSDSVAASQL